MGVIAMEVTGSFISRGVSHVTQAAYIYCDTCGSFRITKTLSGRQWALILGVVFIDAILKYFGFPWWGLIVMTLALGIPVAGLWGVSGYRCLKCGRGTTIKYNTRNYQSITGVLDVPKEQVEKVYFGYWTDDGDLEENLKPPQPRTDKRAKTKDDSHLYGCHFLCAAQFAFALLTTPSDDSQSRLRVGSSPKYDEENSGYAYKV